jgi:UDP-N-acetylglucosamine 2-epimerase
LPAVDVGVRQQGRERAINVIHSPPETEAIVAAANRALDPDFRAGLGEIENPYGDGRSAERIVRLLADVPLGEPLLMKRAVDMSGSAGLP